MRDGGNPRGAAEGFAKLLATAERVFPAGDMALAAIQGNYAAALLEVKDYAAAEPLLIASYQAFKKVFGAGDPRLQVPRERIERLYREWGKPERIAPALR